MTDYPADRPNTWSSFAFEETRAPDTGVQVFHLTGTLSDHTGGYALLRLLREEMGSSPVPILLDLSDVDHMTSCGVGIIAAAIGEAQKVDRKICLCGAGPRVSAVLRAVGLARTLDVYDCETSALEALST